MNPSAVLNAFAPAHPGGQDVPALTLEALLILEAVGCKFTGGFRDALLIHTALTRLPDLKTWRAKGTVDRELETWAATQPPAALLPIVSQAAAAIEAAFAPSAPVDTDPADPDADPDADPLAALEKKSATAADGGSL